MSAAERLTRAAALLRERAEAATPGPWEVGDYWHIQGAKHCRCEAGPLVWEGVRDINGTRMQTHVHRRAEALGGDVMQAVAADGNPANITIPNDWGDATSKPDAAYIATVSPPFALAVAAWLDETALRWDWIEERELALAVASAVLGEDAGGDLR